MMEDEATDSNSGPEPKKGEPMKRRSPIRILVAVVAGAVAFALFSWLTEGTWHLLDVVTTALLAMLIAYLLNRYDEQLRKPRRVRWPTR
ncbi:MAG TPA: hypothetical protein VG010_10140 [Solirubrobacteraceae bacterium]|jgi:peptidoglycan/LPS O-acetylase OafA/YrhL|nr:hypothetical protein [Solirubrobacteraceae bacterium]